MEYVAYLRISIDEERSSGLGIQAQRHAITGHVEREGGTLIKVFTEYASGGDNDRPVLRKAIRMCKDQGARLISMKLDRIARSVGKVSELLNDEVDFISLDNINGDFLTTSVLSVISEHERRITLHYPRPVP